MPKLSSIYTLKSLKLPPLTHVQKICWWFFFYIFLFKDIDGGWSSWGHWSECSATCGDLSVRKRDRLCNNPIPQNGGKVCEGQIFDLELCNVTSCPQGTRSFSKIWTLRPFFLQFFSQHLKPTTISCYFWVILVIDPPHNLNIIELIFHQF